jgi:hypothetical protein
VKGLPDELTWGTGEPVRSFLKTTTIMTLGRYLPRIMEGNANMLDLLFICGIRVIAVRAGVSVILRKSKR